MAGRGRGRANTLPAWMTKQGLNEPPAGPLPDSRPPPPAEGPPPRNGQFDDAPEPNRGPMTRNDIDRGYGYDADRRREDPYRCGPPRGRSRSRSRERQDYRGDYRRGGDRYENRGYGYRGPRNDGRPMRREEEAMERGYRRPAPNGHDDRTSRRYASDYQP
ncbi:hypothetical protein AM587_10014636 [Phytophthora nicotianae]|uniref:Uncharacterized protein n=1 Tax=Phytophthora nicotianae TaxID=4792 RepID=A0A0W8E1D8_PHYNI|nr:hypothetical protein AM587_10014636 [Phytophthora nicotianae]